jgi:class 3 adenylate cyclase
LIGVTACSRHWEQTSSLSRAGYYRTFHNLHQKQDEFLPTIHYLRGLHLVLIVQKRSALNTMAAISRNFGATIIKNVGDCLILCYPRTSDTSNKSAFNDVLECCITMIEARNTINQKLHEEGLPSLSYRISADYGRVEVARSATSQSDDLFGPTMNMCSKINSKAPTNGVAIGDGLYKAIICKPHTFI